MVIEYFLEWVKTASVANRVNAAIAIARACTRKELMPDERDEIEAALTVLLEDNSADVRRAIAETLGAHSNAPRHIVNALANDNEDIAVIILSRSAVFHDAELISYLRKGSPNSQIAISCRPWLSGSVTSAICAYGCKSSALGVLMNSAAACSTADLHKIAERHGISADIRQILLKRENLAADTRHMLIAKLGEALSGFVKEKAWMPESRLQKAIDEASDRASVLMVAKTQDDEVLSVVRSLIAQDRLTVSLLVRSLCMGNISLVAYAISELSGVRFRRVEAILTKNRQSAFKAVYDRAGLPKSVFIVFQTAVKAWRNLLESETKIDQHRLPFVVTREVLEEYVSSGEGVVDDMLVLLRQLLAETAREKSAAKAAEISARGVNQELSAIEDTSSVDDEESIEDAQLVEVSSEQDVHVKLDNVSKIPDENPSRFQSVDDDRDYEPTVIAA